LAVGFQQGLLLNGVSLVVFVSAKHPAKRKKNLSHRKANSQTASPEISGLLMEPERSLPCSQDHVAGSYPDEINRHHSTIFRNIHPIIAVPSMPRSFDLPLSFMLSNVISFCPVHIPPMRAICPAPLILDLLILMIYA
jgi:hypothetical protein